MNKMPISEDKFVAMITDSAEKLFKNKTEAVKAVADFMDTIEDEYDTLPERCKEVTEDIIKASVENT